MNIKALQTALDGLDEKKSILVFTSYYGNMKRLAEAGVIPVRIARYAPRYVHKHPAVESLMPDATLLSLIKAGKITEAEYKVQYKAMLDKLNPQQVYDELVVLGKGGSVAIMCYEKPPEMCHRHIVTDWLKETLNIDIPEFSYKK